MDLRDDVGERVKTGLTIHDSRNWSRAQAARTTPLWATPPRSALRWTKVVDEPGGGRVSRNALPTHPGTAPGSGENGGCSSSNNEKTKRFSVALRRSSSSLN